MRRVEGIVTKEDILKHGAEVYPSSPLQTRPILDYLTQVLGFKYGEDKDCKMFEFAHGILIRPEKDYSLNVLKGNIYPVRAKHHWSCPSPLILTIENLIPDYVDPMTAMFNKVSERLDAMENRLAALEAKYQPPKAISLKVQQPGANA